MEASKFGFDPNTPPAFKFDPTDADIVTYYLLPRAFNLPNPYAHAIIDLDPGGLPPWKLLRQHDPNGTDHAFFFRPPADASKNGGRTSRTVDGGTWQGQSSYYGKITLMSPDGGEVDIKYKRYNLTFYLEKGGPSTGYIMHEYEITSPPLPGTILTRVKFADNAKKRMAKAPAATSADQQVALPVQKRPRPSYDAAVMTSGGDAVTGAQAGALYGGMGASMAEPGHCYIPNHFCLPASEQQWSYDTAVIKSEGEDEGFTGAQSDAPYGGMGASMAETDAYYYSPQYVVPLPEGRGDADDYNYCQYQQAGPYQLEPNHQFQAGDAAVMSAGGVDFSGGQQAGVLCAYGNDGSDVGTDTIGQSALPLCVVGGEDDCDENFCFYDALVCDGDDFKIEPNDAGEPATNVE